MNKIKLIGVDLDGTALNKNKRITEHNKRAFEECRRRGIYVVPVTGRPYSGLYDEYKKDICCRYSINTNGAAVMDVSNNERIISHIIQRDTATKLMSILSGFNCYYGVFHDGYGYLEKDRYYYELNKYLGTPMHRYILTSRRITESQIDLINRLDYCDNIYVIADSTAERDRISEAISSVGNIFYTCSFSDDVEIGGNCSKGSSLLELADLIGIDRSEIMAIGDSGNDLNMLESAGFAVAMENAEEEIKKASDFVTASCEDSGVALAIEKFVL